VNEKLQGKAASIHALRERARRRLPKYVFEYVAGGCITDCAVRANRESLENLKLHPRYLGTAAQLDSKCDLLDREYNLPMGIAPIGLSGLIWPRSGEYLARAAKQANIPFVLSTVGTTSIETAARHAEENFWFQIYPPPDDTIRLDLVKRTREVGCTHLVVTVDVPALGRRPRDLQNGIAIPPKLNVRTLLQTAMRPSWSLATLATGMPQFANLDPYLGDIKGMKNRAYYIRSVLKDVVDGDLLKRMRDEWPHKLIVKGILTAEDARTAVELGADAVWISNHGGRQLDPAAGAVSVVREVAASVGNQVPILADSGVESGTDIVRFLSQGANMVFAGRPFMYGVAAFGQPGAEHAIDILSAELEQTLSQLGCANPSEATQRLA